MLLTAAVSHKPRDIIRGGSESQTCSPMLLCKNHANKEEFLNDTDMKINIQKPNIYIISF